MVRAQLTKLLFTLLGWLPLPLARVLGKLVGWLNYQLNTQASKVTAANLQLCFPELSVDERKKLLIQSLQHTGQMMFETPRVWMRHISDNDRLILEVRNRELLDAQLAHPSGTIIVLPHLGNWEMFNVYFARHGVMTALYSPPRKAYLQQMMAEVRKKFGNDMVPTTRAGIASLYRQLASGHVVTILPDQVPASGVQVPFFGETTLTDVLVSRLAQKTGARLLCAVIERVSGGFVVHFVAPDAAVYDPDPETSVAAVNRSVENCVRLAPAQYQWEYKRFKHRLPGKDKMYRFKK